MRWPAALLLSCAPALAAAAEGGEHASGGLPQMDVTNYPSQLFWLAVMFAVLYAVFSRWTLPAFSATMEERAQRIHADLEAAKSLKEEAEAVHTAYEASLADARAQAAAMFQAAEEDAKAKTWEALEAFRRDGAVTVAEAEAALDKAKTKALADIEAAVAGPLAEAVADRLMAEGRN